MPGWSLPPRCSARDWVLIAAMGLGPLGAAFFLWDRALKLGDPRQIGILSYVTPLASTLLLMIVSGRALSWSIALAAVLIIGAAVLGTRAGARRLINRRGRRPDLRRPAPAAPRRRAGRCRRAAPPA